MEVSFSMEGQTFLFLYVAGNTVRYCGSSYPYLLARFPIRGPVCIVAVAPHTPRSFLSLSSSLSFFFLVAFSTLASLLRMEGCVHVSVYINIFKN